MNLLHGLLPLPVIGGATLPERILNAIRLVMVYANSTRSRILRNLVQVQSRGVLEIKMGWRASPKEINRRPG